MLFRKLANEVCRPLLFRAMSSPNTSKVKQMKSDGKSNIVWVDLEVNFLCKSVMSMWSLTYFHFHFAQYVLKAPNPISKIVQCKNSHTLLLLLFYNKKNYLYSYENLSVATTYNNSKLLSTEGCFIMIVKFCMFLFTCTFI